MLERIIQLAEEASTGAVLVAALLLTPHSANAARFTFEFSGEVFDMYSDPGSPPPSPWNVVQIGDPWRLTYTFESTTPDNDVPPAFGTYPGALLSYSLNVGPAHQSAAPMFDDHILIESGNALRDAYSVNVFPPSFNPQHFRVWLLDTTDTSWVIDALPTSLSLAGFDYKELLVEGADFNYWWIQGDFRTFAVVPEPAAGLLVLLPIALPWRRPRPSRKLSRHSNAS